MMAPQATSFKPDRSESIPARQDIHMNPKVRYEEAVDDVFGCQKELNRPACRYVQLVNLPLPVGMLKFPHPLFGNDVNDAGIVGSPVRIEVDKRPIKEENDEDPERSYRPEDFEWC